MCSEEFTFYIFRTTSKIAYQDSSDRVKFFNLLSSKISKFIWSGNGSIDKKRTAKSVVTRDVVNPNLFEQARIFWCLWQMSRQRWLGPSRATKGSVVMQIFNQLCFIFKVTAWLLFLGPVSVGELFFVEDAASARFARYGIEINILTCLWF